MIEEKSITIDELAIMVQTGFREIQADLNEFKMEMKEFRESVDKRFTEMRTYMDHRFDRIEQHQNDNEKKLEKTEQIVYFDHTPRITKLENK